MNGYQYVPAPTGWIDPLGLQRGPVLLGLGHLYRSNESPPLPTAPRNVAIDEVLNIISNYPFENERLPGEWVGVNVPWSMPELSVYCADGYYGDDSHFVDNSGKTRKPKK
ncbi:hypothetical protein [Burkholderia diffusa]|uniref:hypothetical protein n=1 Tax=Burkholderia diffusa TaxID=488732 RepID=UPI00124718F9|nr:hypothetical protein [Burkholderia diffusa]KAB0657278.1 hypothetical protein F7R23_11510 [Burkholderia diffusa]MBM2654866.1 hypothetical protein [Burkholderia diffusa]